MGNSAAEIVQNFMRETGVALTGTSLKNCLKFGEAILVREEDEKLLRPSLRNCQRYSEDRMSPEFRISHATFQNDENLHAMATWYINKLKAGKDVKENPEDVKALKEIIRRQKNQIKGLIEGQQNFDDISARNHKSQISAVRNRILFQRAMNVLKALGHDADVNQNVSAAEIGIVAPELLKYLPCDPETGEILGQQNDENIDEQ